MTIRENGQDKVIGMSEIGNAIQTPFLAQFIDGAVTKCQWWSLPPGELMCVGRDLCSVALLPYCSVEHSRIVIPKST